MKEEEDVVKEEIAVLEKNPKSRKKKLEKSKVKSGPKPLTKEQILLQSSAASLFGANDSITAPNESVIKRWFD